MASTSGTVALTPLPVSRRLLAALPDAVTAGAFGLTWVAPAVVGMDFARTLVLLMLVEFVLIHATAFTGHVVLDDSRSRRARAGTLLGFGAFYSLFIVTWAWMFDAGWPLLALAWLLAGKLTHLFRGGASAEDKRRMQSDWALAVMCYLGGVFLTVLLPVPRLGITPAVKQAMDIPGDGGLWVNHPETVLVFGFVYFGTLAWCAWRDVVLPQSSRTQHTDRQ